MATETTRKIRKVTKAAPAKGEPAHVTPLKAVCSTLKIEPRAARRILRANKFDWHAPRARWDMLTDVQLSKVTTVLKEHRAA